MRASSSAAATPLRLQIGSSSILLPPSLSSIASNATASASLSALLPPLPSRFPSDLILHFQQPEHEESTAVNLVRQRPAPDLYLPPLRWHVTGDFSEVTAATGGSAVPPSLTVAGTSQQGRRQPDQDLRTFWCFELVNSDELDAAASQSALQEITELATPFRTSTHRVAAYFVEAMPARLVSSCVGRWLFTSLPHASSCLAAVNTRTDTRFQVFDAAKQAIQEAFEREDGSHIIITRLIQWPGLLHIFASGPSGPPRIRLTGLGASMEAFQATGKRFLDFADTLGMSNEFCLMSYKTRNLDLEKLGIGARWRTAHSLYHVTFNNLNTLYLIQRYKLNDQRDTNNEVKWASEKQDGGEEKISKWNAGLNTASLVFIKYPNTYTPGCIQETYEGKTICDLDDKGEYELPKVWLTKENMQKLKKKKKAVAPSFTAFKVAGIKNHTRYFLLLVLFCNLITGIGSSSRSQSSRQGFCPKPDIMLVLLPAHETVCPLLDISSVHWTHSKREETQQRETTYICEVAVFLISAVCCLGPWFSVSNLEPVQGKVHKFLYFFSLTPVKMWYLTLAMSVNYYVSMVVYGVMSKSDQSCEIWGSNAIYCSIFLLLVAYLCYRQKITFQVDNMVLLVTCLYVGAGAVSIGLMHGAFVLLRPANFEQTFYFEKIALMWLVVMFVFRISTVEYTAFNAILNIMAALTPLSLFCTHGNKWDGILVISSSALRIIECVIWGIWWMLGRNILIVIENVNP